MSETQVTANRMVVSAMLLMTLLSGVEHSALAQTQRYVARVAAGDGSGSSAANAAAYNNAAFWDGVQSSLAADDVNVTFLNGSYTSGHLILAERGHAGHRLTLQSQSPGGAVFDGIRYLQLRGSQNITVRNFGFTGAPADPSQRFYKLNVTAHNGVPSQNVLLEGNRFYDAPTYYGAIGVSLGSNHVTIYDNTFRNIGQDSHAHMIYNAYDVHHIKVVGNQFEDSTGDYIRFRDNADFGEVRDNTFISTAEIYNRPFVQMPVFNSADPGHEVHASNYLIRHNSFEYQVTAGHAPWRDAMGYLSWGYEPPGLNYLPSDAEGDILENGTIQQKRELLLNTMGIDLTKVRVYGNAFTGENLKFRYGASAQYGAQSQGWEGDAELFDAINSFYLGAGDVYSDGALTTEDIALFLLAVDAPNELAFLLDDRVWFGDYAAADINGDGVVDLGDVAPFIELFGDILSDHELDQLRAMIPEPGMALLMGAGLMIGLSQRQRGARRQSQIVLVPCVVNG